MTFMKLPSSNHLIFAIEIIITHDVVRILLVEYNQQVFQIFELKYFQKSAVWSDSFN